MIRTMRTLALAMLLSTGAAFASDANFNWNSSPLANSHSLYYSTTSGIFPFTPNVTTTGTSHTAADGELVQNVANYVIATASNASGESAPGEEISGFPRPRIVSALPVDQGPFIRLTITGSNFSDGMGTTDVQIVGMTVIAVTRLDATQIAVDYTCSTCTGVASEMTISNSWIGNAGFVASVPSTIFLVPSLVPTPPIWQDVN